MSFAHPHLLWLLAALPLLAALRWWWGARARRAQAGVGARTHVRGSPGRAALRQVALWTGATAALAALAGPRWGGSEQRPTASGGDLAIVLDCSRSMLAADLYPDRLRAGRDKVNALLARLPELRVALVPFAGAPVLRCPPTGDHLAVATLLEDCTPDLFPALEGWQGTAIGAAVREGLRALEGDPGRPQAVLVISDGADPDADAVRAAGETARKAGVPVYGLFLGDPGRESVVAIDGRPVAMTADRATLDALAGATGGIAVNAMTDDSDVAALADHLGHALRDAPWESHARVVASERYRWALLPALALLALGWLLPTARRPLAALLLVAVLPLGAAEPWRELAGIAAQAARDPEAARTRLEALVLAHPDFAPARFNLGTLLLERDPAAAAPHLEAATASPRGDVAAAAWHNLALARLRLGRLDDALTAAERALALRPDDADLRRTRDEARRAALAAADAERRKQAEAAKRLRLAGTELPPARAGEPYAAAIAAAGGTAPYRITAARLPEGLTLAVDGTFAGTPTAKAVGRHDLAVTVADGAQGTASGSVRLLVLPAPAITTDALPEAVTGQSYRAELACIGLDLPRWSADGLPAGLILESRDGAALITGTPTAAGTAVVRLRVADATRSAERTLDLVVADGFAPSETRLPPATAWSRYRHQLGVRGPAGTYRWRQAQAEEGVTIAGDGAVGGEPARAGDLALHATLAAADGRSREVVLTLPVNPPPVIDLDAELTLTRGRAIDRAVPVSGGTPPYRWSQRGAVDGLRLDPDGHLRGAPGVAGTTELTLICSDRWSATAEHRVRVTVSEPPEQKQDDRQDQQDDQAKQDGQQGDQQQQQKQDQQKQDQAGQQQRQQGDRQQQDAQAGEEPQQATPDQGQASAPKPDQQQEDARSAAKPAERGAGADGDRRPDAARDGAVERWLDALPTEDRSALREQLLRTAPRRRGSEQPW